MRYGFFIFLTGFLLLDILPIPPEEFPSRREVRGQSGDGGELSEGVQVSEDGLVHLQGVMDIADLVKVVSEINGETYIIDDSVTPKEVTIITAEGGMEKEDVLILFDTILRVNGLAVIKSDGINKVVNSSDVASHSTPVETDSKD